MKTNPGVFTFCLDREVGSGCLSPHPGFPANWLRHLGLGILSVAQVHGDLDLFPSDVSQLRDAAILDHLSGSLGCPRTGKWAYDWQALALRTCARACTLCLYQSPEALTLNPFIRISQ